jgi:hypothetical protein
MMETKIDFDRLLKLRLVVARVGEMDLAKWWNTRGQLSRLGTAAIRRGFPRTHYFAQARSVFAVAAFRCREIFDPPHSITLWQLPEAVEEEFESHWERWLDQADEWKPFFMELETLKTGLKTALQSFNLVSDDDSELFSRLRRSAEGRECHCLLHSPAQTRTSHRLRLASRVARWAHSPSHTRAWTTHEGADPIPRRLVVHSHQGSYD